MSSATLVTIELAFMADGFIITVIGILLSSFSRFSSHQATDEMMRMGPLLIIFSSLGLCLLVLVLIFS